MLTMLRSGQFSALVILFLVHLSCAGATEHAGSTVYDSDPRHLWNRLNETLFLRGVNNGRKYGLDSLDILFWHRTKHLLVDPSRQPALNVLDEFIIEHGEKQIRDPLKRALLQRDLW